MAKQKKHEHLKIPSGFGKEMIDELTKQEAKMYFGNLSLDDKTEEIFSYLKSTGEAKGLLKKDTPAVISEILKGKRKPAFQRWFWRKYCMMLMRPLPVAKRETPLFQHLENESKKWSFISTEGLPLYLKKELTWMNAICTPPQEGIDFLIGGLEKINVGQLVQIKRKFVWKLITGKKVYATLEEFPYWADVRAPLERNEEFDRVEITIAKTKTSKKK